MKINVNNANIAITVGNSRQFPKDPRPEVALSGRSNVGKSSLINTLLGRKSLARVSSSPGKSITINYYDIDKKFISSTDKLDVDYSLTAPEDAKYARIEIVPVNDNYISIFKKHDYLLVINASNNDKYIDLPTEYTNCTLYCSNCNEEINVKDNLLVPSKTFYIIEKEN